MTAKKSAPAPATKAAPTPKTAAKAKVDDTTKKVAKPAAKAVEVAAKGKPGRKGKVEEKTVKKSEDNDVDLSDLESDLEGEPEVETATDETKVKAKPLRMKVSRAKERALMREFGLEETALTEEEASSAARSSRPSSKWARRAAS